MKTRCPACGATTSLDALLGHSDAGQAFVSALSLLGDLQKPMVKYLGLFRAENRDLTFERTAKLLGDIAPDIVAKQIKRGHHTYPAPTGAWVWAINTILERREQGKLQLPFKNHGYLYEVITSYKPEFAPTPSTAANQSVLVTEKSHLERTLERQEHERLKHAKPAMGFKEMMAKAQVPQSNTDEKPHRELKGIPTSQLLAHLKQHQQDGETTDQCFQRLKAAETEENT